MNILREEMIKYAGIIKEDIGTDRILTCFRKFYKGNSNALNDATFGNVCYKTAGNKTEANDKGILKLQISDLAEKLKKEGITATSNLLGLKEYIRKKLTEEGILNDQNKTAYDSVFKMFAEKMSSNMEYATKSLKKAQ
jgi:hypothetical protein